MWGILIAKRIRRLHNRCLHHIWGHAGRFVPWRSQDPCFQLRSQDPTAPTIPKTPQVKWARRVTPKPTAKPLTHVRAAGTAEPTPRASWPQRLRPPGSVSRCPQPVWLLSSEGPVTSLSLTPEHPLGNPLPHPTPHTLKWQGRDQSEGGRAEKVRAWSRAEEAQLRCSFLAWGSASAFSPSGLHDFSGIELKACLLLTSLLCLNTNLGNKPGLL